MSKEKVKEYLSIYGLANKILELNVSIATVELAASALNVECGRIAKTLAFRDRNGSGCMLIVTAGDTKIDNSLFKTEFSFKARMLNHEETIVHTGHAVGGVCPFAIPKDVRIYIDESLKRFDTVFPACGSTYSAIELSPIELFNVLNADKWISVCKIITQGG